MLTNKKLLRWAHHIALFAIVFASLAPSVSHALVASIDDSRFGQEVCTSDGRVITVPRILGDDIVVNDNDTNDQNSTNVLHHLNHCPFCRNMSADVAIQVPHAPIIALLSTKSKQLFSAKKDVVLPRCFTVKPPSQAPPII